MNSWKLFSKLIMIWILAALLLWLSVKNSTAFQNLASAEARNGDAFADLVVGVPHENVYDIPIEGFNSGMLHVIFGFPQGLGSQDNETWHQDMDFSQDQVERHDQFARALTSGDFNGDGRYDLAVGVPYETVNDGPDEERSAGAVHVIYGSNSAGLTPASNQFIHQDTSDIEGSAEGDDHFGYSLAVGNFNGDDYDDLAIGVPHEDFEYGPIIFDGGSVIVIYGSAGGLSPTAVLPDQMWHQDSDDGVKIIDQVEGYDYFGYALAAGNFDADPYDDLAIGAYGENSSSLNDIGVVHVLYGTSTGLSAARNQQWEQYDWDTSQSEAGDKLGMSLAAGDFDHDGKDDLAIGVPGEDLVHPSNALVQDAGLVNILYGTPGGLDDAGVEVLFQDGIMISEIVDTRDQFGYTLAAVDFDGSGQDYLVVGVPYEDLGNPEVRDAGAVHVITRNHLGTYEGKELNYFHQDRDSIPDELVEAANFGYALAPGDYNGDGKEDLAIGAPGDSCNVTDDGSVVVVYKFTWIGEIGLIPQRWCQGGAIKDQGELGDDFGFSLTSLPSSGALPFRSYLPILPLED